MQPDARLHSIASKTLSGTPRTERWTMKYRVLLVIGIWMAVAAPAPSEQSVQITQIVPTQEAAIIGILSNDEMPSFLIWNLCLESLELKTLVEIDRAKVPYGSPDPFPWCHPESPVWRSSYVLPWYARLWDRFLGDVHSSFLFYRFQGPLSYGLNADGDVVQLTDSAFQSGRLIGAIPGTDFLLFLRPLVEYPYREFANQPLHSYILLDNRRFAKLDGALISTSIPSDELPALLLMPRAVSPAFGSDNNLVLIREIDYGKYTHIAHRLLRLSPFEELFYVSRPGRPDGVNQLGKTKRRDGWTYGLFADDSRMSVRECWVAGGLYESIRYMFEQDDDGEIAGFVMKSLERFYVDPRVDTLVLWECRVPLEFVVYGDSRNTLYVNGLDHRGEAYKTSLEIDPQSMPIRKWPTAIGLDGRWFTTVHAEGRIALWEVDFPDVRHLSTHRIVYQPDNEEALRLERIDDISHRIESSPVESSR